MENEEGFAGHYTPPSLLEALNNRVLTEEEAEWLENFMNDPNIPRHAGVEMETVDASVLIEAWKKKEKK